MPQIPLGLQSYERTRGSFPEVILRNLYLEEDSSGSSIDKFARIQRAGLNPLLTFPAAIRGIYQQQGVFDNLTFVVAGDTLYSTDWTTFTAIGTLPNDGQRVRMQSNFRTIGIVTANQFWAWDGTSLYQLHLPDDSEPIDLEVVNGYYILPLASGRFYWLEPDKDDFYSSDEVLDFATAEAVPDGLVGVARIRDELFFFGYTSIEVWQASGSANAAFQRAAGRLLDRGCSSRDTIVLYDNSVVFVGEQGIVYRIGDVPERLSTFGIEERISRATDYCSAFSYTSDGHNFYVLTIPGEGTFAFDAATKGWSEFATVGATTWRATHGIDTPLGPIAGDAQGVLSALDPECPTDCGAAIERAISGTVPLGVHRIANPSLTIYTGAEAPATFSIRWRDAQSGYHQPRLVNARSGSDILNIWRLGASRGAYRTFEISTLSPTIVRLGGALVNEGRAS